MLTKLISDQVDQREIAIILRELDRVLAAATAGDVVEFGCYVGTTSVFLADRLRASNRQLYLYDSFEGLPEKDAHDASPAGTQFRAGELRATKRQLITNLKRARVPSPHITKAWFSELTPADVPDTIAFAFLDGDYYRSIKDPLLLITPRLVRHAVIVVDDYANEALPGARVATDEWLAKHPAKLRVEHSLAIIHT